MAADVDVVSEDLVSHASNIDSIGERFGNILSAVDSISQDNEAYGIICQFLPPVLAGRQERHKGLVAMAQTNLENLSQALRDTADAYDSADEATAKEHEQLLNEL